MHIRHADCDAGSGQKSSVPGVAMADAVRVSSGVSYAPGCFDEHGKLSWRLMRAVMARGATPSVVVRDAEPVAEPAPFRPQPEDYAAPECVAGSFPGRVYCVLLALADADAVLPTNEALAELAGSRSLARAGHASEGLEKLVRNKLIVRRVTRGGRMVRIVATGQVLRSAGLLDDEP